MCVKNYAIWLAIDKVIAKIIRLTFWVILYIVKEDTDDEK